MKSPIKRRHLLLVSTFCLLTIFTLLYFTHSGYTKLISITNRIPYGTQFFTKVEDIFNELDLIRSFQRNGLIQSDLIDLKLSSSDIKLLEDGIEYFLESNHFMRDEDKKWRKGKILIDNHLEKIKYKFHGTSLSPMRRGGFSLRIKHKKDGQYKEYMRTYALISSKDEPGLNTLFINNIANEMGLLSPKGKMVILRINGVKIGMYTMFEYNSKEWFEKRRKITNYAIIKSNDDWDTKRMSAHFDDTDLLIEDKEIDGTAVRQPFALGALDVLMGAVKANDFTTIENLIDLKYMAKFIALLTIVNDSHQISGDNLKYVFDFTTGKFQIIFRWENNTLVPISINNIEDFNESLFASRQAY